MSWPQCAADEAKKLGVAALPETAAEAAGFAKSNDRCRALPRTLVRRNNQCPKLPRRAIHNGGQTSCLDRRLWATMFACLSKTTKVLISASSNPARPKISSTRI